MKSIAIIDDDVHIGNMLEENGTILFANTTENLSPVLVLHYVKNIQLLFIICCHPTFFRGFFTPFPIQIGFLMQRRIDKLIHHISIYTSSQPYSHCKW